LYLKRLLADPLKKDFLRHRHLCRTIAGNVCHQLTITDLSQDAKIPMHDRRGVIITGRVHPGESNASWMMKGAIDFLTSDEPHACMLRSKFVFKIVPMLNPDGVVVGNYRCSLAGQDLNRNWLTPTKFAHPTLHYTKMMMRRLISDRPVLVAVDLHGHSRKQNIFMYGVDPLRRLNPRVFPRMLDDCAPGFTFNNCSFRVSRSKLATARAVWANELGLVNGYTMEASFAGADVGDLKGVQFTARDLEDMGVQFCMNILRFDSAVLYDEAMMDLEARKEKANKRGESSDSDSDDGEDDVASEEEMREEEYEEEIKSAEIFDPRVKPRPKSPPRKPWVGRGVTLPDKAFVRVTQDIPDVPIPDPPPRKAKSNTSSPTKTKKSKKTNSKKKESLKSNGPYFLLSSTRKHSNGGSPTLPSSALWAQPNMNNLSLEVPPPTSDGMRQTAERLAVRRSLINKKPLPAPRTFGFPSPLLLEAALPLSQLYPASLLPRYQTPVPPAKWRGATATAATESRQSRRPLGAEGVERSEDPRTASGFPTALSFGKRYT
jgi:hypothetical protein